MIETAEEAREIPLEHFRVGFNDYYMTDDGEEVAVPNGTEVPDEWTLLSD
jgi:hypothetical protein